MSKKEDKDRRERDKIRVVLAERDGNKCFYCREEMSAANSGSLHRVTVEHLTSKKDGGTDDLRNLVLAGGRCNGRVGSLPREIKMEMRRTWYSPEWTDYPTFFGRRGKWVRGPIGKVWKDAEDQAHPREYDYDTAWKKEKKRRKEMRKIREDRNKQIRIMINLALQRGEYLDPLDAERKLNSLESAMRQKKTRADIL